MKLSIWLGEGLLWGLATPPLVDRPLAISTLLCTLNLEAFEQGRDVLLLHIPGNVLVAATWSCQVSLSFVSWK